MLTIILLMLVVVIGGGVAVGNVAATRRKRLASSPTPKALPAPGKPRDHVVERTIRDLRVGDVLTIDNKDFLVEGTIAYDEDGHRWSGARVVDGKEVRWAIVGIERAGASLIRLLTQDTETEISGYPPEVIVVGELRYKLDKRGTATAKLVGDLGAISGGKGKNDVSGEGAVDRCRWWLYGAAGDDTLVLEQWSGEYRLLRGKKVASETIDLIPGS